jgi:hypothetical protein
MTNTRNTYKIQPLIVSPSQACVMLSIGMTQCYALMNSGALESFKDGKSRKITVRSIETYVESRVQGKQISFIKQRSPAIDFEDISNEDDPIEEVTRLQTIIQQEKDK